MADKENHHYVPKFYLRNFSFENDRKQIGVFHLKTNFFFQTAAIKSQASKKRFYGQDDELENILADIEGKLATTHRNICTSITPPKINTADHQFLLFSLVLAELRNPESIRKTKESYNNLREMAQSKGAKEEYVGQSLSHEEAIKLSIGNINYSVPYLLDLRIKILRNCTKNPFITSDNPVVSYNQLLEIKKSHGSSTGYGCLGVQYFYPFSPNLCIMLYDGGIYKMGNRKQTVIEVKEKNDVNQINLLQMLNCGNQVFFNEQIRKDYILKLSQTAQNYQAANQVITQELGGNNMNSTSSYILTHSSDCKIGLKLTFIKMLSKGKHFKLDSRAVYLRDHAYKLRKRESR